jgi:hypothetical protein
MFLLIALQTMQKRYKKNPPPIRSQFSFEAKQKKFLTPYKIQSTDKVRSYMHMHYTASFTAILL